MSAAPNQFSLAFLRRASYVSLPLLDNAQDHAFGLWPIRLCVPKSQRA